MASHKRFFAIVVLLFYMSALSGASLFKRKHVTVFITNSVYPKVEMGVHCKSKDDDLGLQHIQPGQTYDFGFRPNFWGTTQFFCSFYWPQSDQHWFDIYKFGDKNTSDCQMCSWSIFSGGPCRYELDGTSVGCFPWNKD